MRGAQGCAALLIAVLMCMVAPAIAAEYSFRIVDGLGVPIADVKVSIYWLESLPKEEVRRITLFEKFSDSQGKVHVKYSDVPLPAGKSVNTEFSKKGYENISDSRVLDEYVLKRQVGASDWDRAMALPPEDKRWAVREILAGVQKYGGQETEGLRDRAFYHAEEARVPLRDLVRDDKVGESAAEYLALIGFPEDMEKIVRSTPAAKDQFFQNRWLYDIACSMLEPTTDQEWHFLKKAALNEYNDYWVQGAAITSLRLIASRKSRAILNDVRKKEKDLDEPITGMIAYIDSAPPALSDADLVKAGKKTAAALKIGKWQGNQKPRLSKSGELALIDSEFIAGRDMFIYTSTFHKVGNIWKLRGTRETMQALLAIEPEK